jgi:hypothetical protein
MLLKGLEKLLTDARTTTAAELERLASEISAKEKTRADVSEMLLPITAAKDGVKSWLDVFEHRNIPAGLFGQGAVAQSDLDPTVLLIRACRPQVEAYLENQVTAYYDGRLSGTRADRAAQLMKIDAELDRLYRAEERLIREAERAGLAVTRRPDAPPAVVILSDEALAA